MQLQKIETEAGCDIPDCKSVAKYTLKLRRFWNLGNTNFCWEHLNELYIEIGKLLIPKGLKNILIKEKKYKKDE
jgi:hypothetical protein